LSGAATLLREGYATARPIAAVEHRRRGVLIRSFLSCRGSNGSKNDRGLLVRGPPFAKRHRRSLEKTGRVENIGTPVQNPFTKKEFTTTISKHPIFSHMIKDRQRNVQLDRPARRQKMF